MCLTRQTIESLLKTDVDSCDEFVNSDISSTIIGYPKYPLYLEVGRKLEKWLKYGQSFLVDEKVKLELLEDDFNPKEKETVRNLVDAKLRHLSESWEGISACAKKELIVDILESLQLRGILDLIGMRQTIGSIDLFPPPLSMLWEAFKMKNKPSSNLWCGAKALAKHCHRDSTSQWWGRCTGSEHDKNKHAKTVLNKILEDACWINIHMLPHEVKVLEVRNQLGYGARWLCNGTAFRGFLEPQMQDGHTNGWRH